MVTMIYLSNKSMTSDWVRWEIEQSVKMGKGVISAYKGYDPPADIPNHINNNANSVVPWKHDSMMVAVDKAAKER